MSYKWPGIPNGDYSFDHGRAVWNKIINYLRRLSEKLDADIVDATADRRGMMTAADKATFDAIPTTYALKIGELLNNELTRTSPSGHTAMVLRPGSRGSDPNRSEIVDFGWDVTNCDGAVLGLRSVSHTTQPGYFQLNARDATNESILQGTPSGDLTWKNNKVITIVDEATQSVAGLMSATDKALFDDIPNTYVPLVGNSTISGSVSVRNTAQSGNFVQIATDLTRGNVNTPITKAAYKYSFRDTDAHIICGIYSRYDVTDSNNYYNRVGLYAFNPSTTSNEGTSTDLAAIIVGKNQNGSFTSAPTPPSNDDSNQIATTEWVRDYADTVAVSYLPLTGGTLTGGLTVANIAPYINTDSTAKYLRLMVTDYYGGASIYLFGSTYNSSPGEFNVHAYDGTNRSTLNGKPDGTLTWGGNNVLTDAVSYLTTSAAASTYLPLTGGTIQGRLEINSAHNSLSNTGLLISGNNQNYAIVIKDTGLTKGTGLPASYRNLGIYFNDSADSRLGALFGYVTSAGLSRMAMRAQGATAQTTSTTCTISCNVDANGDIYTEAPTPATSDNSTQIATTAYVQANLANLPGSYGAYNFENKNLSNNTITTLGDYTATKAGMYALHVAVTFASNATGYRRLLLANSNTSANMDRFSNVVVGANPVAETQLQVTFLKKFSANETVYIRASQTSGSTLQVNSGLRAYYLGVA